MENKNDGEIKQDLKHVIGTTDDLRDAILTLKALKIHQENQLKADVSLLQESLAPGNLLKEAAGSLFGGVAIKKNTDMWKQGINLGAQVVTNNILFRNKGPITKFVAETILRFAAKRFVKKSNKKEQKIEIVEIPVE